MSPTSWIKTSEGQLGDARSKLTDAEAKFKQQATLYKKGFATKTAYDTVLANLNCAQSSVEVSTSQLKLAERDLKLTVLKSPPTGQVSEKYVERL